MKINTIQNDTSINFKGKLILKTNDPKVLVTLTEKGSKWEHSVNPKVLWHRFSGAGPEADGYYQGILLDKTEKNVLHSLDKLCRQEIEKPSKIKISDNSNPFMMHVHFMSYILSTADTVIVNSLEELRNLPMLKGMKLVESKQAKAQRLRTERRSKEISNQTLIVKFNRK